MLLPPHIKHTPLLSWVFGIFNKYSSVFFSCSGPKPWSQSLIPYCHPVFNLVIRSVTSVSEMGPLTTAPVTTV